MFIVIGGLLTLAFLVVGVVKLYHKPAASLFVHRKFSLSRRFSTISRGTDTLTVAS